MSDPSHDDDTRPTDTPDLEPPDAAALSRNQQERLADPLEDPVAPIMDSGPADAAVDTDADVTTDVVDGADAADGEGQPTTSPVSPGNSLEDAIDSDGTSSRRAWMTVLIVGVVAAIAAGSIAAGFLLTDDDSPDASGVPSGEMAAKPQLDLATAGAFDSFARPDGPLGGTDSGQSWESASGSWRVQDATARLLEPSATGPSIAVVNMRVSDGIVQITMPSPQRGSGLLFRYVNQFEHWSLTAAPGSATWVITKVDDGVAEKVGTLGTSPVDPNVTVAVEFVGDELTFFVDGVERTSLSDDFLSDAVRVGLVARGPEAIDASWTNLVAIAKAS